MADSDNPFDRAAHKAFQGLHLATNEILRTHRQQVLDIQKAVESSYKPVQEAFRQQAELLRQQQLSAANPIRQLIKENQRIAEGLLQWKQWAQDQPKRDQEEEEALIKLAELGWYCDPDMPWTALEQCARAIDKGDAEEVVEAVREYFQEQLNAIEKKLITSYPHRKQVLHDAFNAHREGKYNLSVPVFLTQADGMWGEKFSTNLFSYKDRETAVSDDILQIKYGLFRSIFSLFLTPVPLWKSKSQRDSSFDELNRHQVLHGEVVNYGTEQNSLKVISFLSCLCWILSNQGE